MVGSSTILKFTYHDYLDEVFQRQMYESALRDGLTKVFNKKYFTDYLEKEFAFAARHGGPLALIFLDIDYFKKINDTHGHPAGDFVLAELSQMMSDAAAHRGRAGALRRRGVHDPVPRLGSVGRARSSPSASARRSRSASSRFGGKDIPVTVSLGVVAIPESGISEHNAFLAAADKALYEAKRSGRNRVCVHGSEKTPNEPRKRTRLPAPARCAPPESSGRLRAEAGEGEQAGGGEADRARQVGRARIDGGVQRAADERARGARQRGGRLQRAQRHPLGRDARAPRRERGQRRRRQAVAERDQPGRGVERQDAQRAEVGRQAEQRERRRLDRTRPSAPGAPRRSAAPAGAPGRPARWRRRCRRSPKMRPVAASDIPNPSAVNSRNVCSMPANQSTIAKLTATAAPTPGTATAARSAREVERHRAPQLLAAPLGRQRFRQRAQRQQEVDGRQPGGDERRAASPRVRTPETATARRRRTVPG